MDRRGYALPGYLLFSQGGNMIREISEGLCGFVYIGDKLCGCEVCT